ncbi:MAG TPA: glycosyltransferase family 2 protein [Atribacteraceae bacterium]|nr:glycosyltransferase family 2 protein [Atribacteraceae bacterium]
MLEGQSIAILVPAYNEAPRIGQVLQVISSIPFVDEVVVIDDGSRDGTAQVARKFPVEIIQLPFNSGKAAALTEAIWAKNTSDLYLCLDADLIRLKEEHLLALIEPLIHDAETVMSIGIFKAGRSSSDFAQKLCPILNGQRALRGDWIRSLPDFSWVRFGVEVFLTRFARDFKAKIAMVPLWGITHYHKEEKYGPVLGFYHRLKMYVEVARAYLLYENEMKGTVRVVEEKREEEKIYARV